MGVILLDDNVRPHTERVTQELLRTFHWDRLEHALYSPDLAPSDFSSVRADLAPSDFHLLESLKNHLGACHFVNDDAIIQEVTRWQ